MGLHLYCPTEHAVLLLAIPNSKGIFQFPSPSRQRPGLWFPVLPRQPINEQIVQTTERALRQTGLSRKLFINQDFAQPLLSPDAPAATLYLSTLAADMVGTEDDWPTMPQLLGAMPKDRSRLPYLLAWQVLSGASSEMIRAVEVDERLNPLH